MSDPVDLPDPPADTNPADDQPTWTTDENGDMYCGSQPCAFITMNDDLGHHVAATPQQEAALVQAVERARLLPAALDVIATVEAWLAAPQGVKKLDRYYEIEAAVGRWREGGRADG